MHSDLHYANVLAGDREPWLAIDPKPLSGRPALRAGADAVEPLGGASSAPAACATRVRRRFHTLVDAAGLDEDRARDWVVVRMVLNALWALEDAAAAGRTRRPATGSG